MSRILLLVELKGGNDGLNTVVPYADAEVPRAAPGDRRGARAHPAARRAGRPAREARAADGIVEGQGPRDRAGRRLSLSQPLAFPLDRDLGHRLGLEPDAERGLDRAGLRGHQPAQGRGRRQHRDRHQCAAQHRPRPAHHRHAGRRELPAPGRGAEGAGRHEGRRQSGAAPSAGGAPRGERRGQGPERQAARGAGARPRPMRRTCCSAASSTSPRAC